MSNPSFLDESVFANFQDSIDALQISVSGKQDASGLGSAAFQSASAFATPSSVTAAINDVVNGAGPALDTLKELADALTADESAAAALALLVGTKASQTDLTALAARVTALETWKNATGIKSVTRYALTTNASGDVTVTPGTAWSATGKVSFIVDGVYSATDHPLLPSVRSLSTTSASIRVYRAMTLILLGTPVSVVASQPVFVTAIEFN